jgi:AcrR family transcriptional regulator
MPTARKSARPAGPQRPAGPGVRELAAQATRQSILRAATKVFATHGFSGATTQLISRAARSHDRMIYCYFGSKESLFTAVLEDQYRQFNEAEAALDLPLHDPRESLRQIVHFVWTYYQKHPEFIRLLNDENLHEATHIARSPNARDCSLPAVGLLRSVLDAGCEQGLFRDGLLAQDVYVMIAAMGYFYLSNRFTLSATLGVDLASADAKTHWEEFVHEAVFRTVRRDGLGS